LGNLAPLLFIVPMSGMFARQSIIATATERRQPITATATERQIKDTAEYRPWPSLPFNPSGFVPVKCVHKILAELTGMNKPGENQRPWCLVGCDMDPCLVFLKLQEQHPELRRQMPVRAPLHEMLAEFRSVLSLGWLTVFFEAAKAIKLTLVH
jgi:hypothetical protein